MRFQDVKGNTNGGIVKGDIISCFFGRETLKIWAGKDIRVYGRDSLAIFSIIDFECEPADDYELVVSTYFGQETSTSISGEECPPIFCQNRNFHSLTCYNVFMKGGAKDA